MMMKEGLVDMFVVVEDAAYIRRERRNGDPDREPDETTEDDVIEAMLRGRDPNPDILGKKDLYTRALRVMIREALTYRGKSAKIAKL